MPPAARRGASPPGPPERGAAAGGGSARGGRPDRGAAAGGRHKKGARPENGRAPFGVREALRYSLRMVIWEPACRAPGLFMLFQAMSEDGSTLNFLAMPQTVSPGPTL